MSKSGQVLKNPISGVELVFVKTAQDTGGLQVVHEVMFPAGKGREYPHVHQLSSEQFEILAGQCTYELGGKTLQAQASEVLQFPNGVVHLHPWNSSTTDVLKLRQTVTFSTPHPTELNKIDGVLETFFGLARDSKVNKDGLPSFLQILVTFGALLPELSQPGMPLPAQRVMSGAAAVIGAPMGIKASYPQYSS